MTEMEADQIVKVHVMEMSVLMNVMFAVEMESKHHSAIVKETYVIVQVNVVVN